VASWQHDRSSTAAVLKVIYLLAVTAVTFMVPALSATRPLSWFVVPTLLAFQVFALVICRIPAGEIVRPAWRLKWLFLFLIGCYALLPPENPAGDLVLHWHVPGLEWLVPFNVTGLERAALMCLQILTLLLASAVVRLTGREDDLVDGLRALRLPALFVYSLDRTLDDPNLTRLLGRWFALGNGLEMRALFHVERQRVNRLEDRPPRVPRFAGEPRTEELGVIDRVGDVQGHSAAPPVFSRVTLAAYS
jgi:hypothetical protein